MSALQQLYHKNCTGSNGAVCEDASNHHSYLLNLYSKCDTNSLQQLYGECDKLLLQNLEA